MQFEQLKCWIVVHSAVPGGHQDVLDFLQKALYNNVNSTKHYQR